MDYHKCVNSLSTLRMLVMEDQQITFDQNEIEWEVEVEANLLKGTLAQDEDAQQQDEDAHAYEQLLQEHIRLEEARFEAQVQELVNASGPRVQEPKATAQLDDNMENAMEDGMENEDNQHVEDDLENEDEIGLENEEENNQHVEEGDLEDEDMEDQPGLFGSVAKASHVLLTLMNGLREEFGVEVAKKMIIETAKQANIPLHTPRDPIMTVDVNVDDMRKRIGRFNTATLLIIQRNEQTNLVDRCVEIVGQIKRLNSTTDYARVAVFVYLLEIAGLLEEADASANHKELNTQLQTNLEIDKLTQYSKFKRKCARVKKLCGILGVPGGCAMAMFIKIYSLENMTNEDFKTILKDLKTKRDLIDFCQTLRVDGSGMPSLR